MDWIFYYMSNNILNEGKTTLAKSKGLLEGSQNNHSKTTNNFKFFKLQIKNHSRSTTTFFKFILLDFFYCPMLLKLT